MRFMSSLSDSPGLGEVLLDAEPVLARLAERLCTNTADARDLVQDTFERAARQGLPDDVRSPRAWLTTMLHNLFIDRCRAAARRPCHEPLDEGLSATAPEPRREPAWSRLEVADIQAALAEIDPTYREVFTLHTFEHWSYEQLAARLSIQRVTVGTRLNRARKKLRDVLVRRFGLELEAPS
jgi:RNA polymerase sigma-70 factor (ECF subfamily)